MHIWLDTPVVTSDGAVAGRVSRLLVHPASWKVLSIAVRQAGWLSREVAVPPEAVSSASPKTVAIALDTAAFQRLTQVRRADWMRPPSQWVTPLGWARSRVYWPAGYHGPVYPEITASQLRGWGTLRAAAWADPASIGSVADRDGPPALGQERMVVHAEYLPPPASGRLELELQRERRGESLLDVDPYDVLARPSECGFKTAYERDDASVINPQRRPCV